MVEKQVEKYWTAIGIEPMTSPFTPGCSTTELRMSGMDSWSAVGRYSSSVVPTVNTIQLALGVLSGFFRFFVYFFVVAIIVEIPHPRYYSRDEGVYVHIMS